MEISNTRDQLVGQTFLFNTYADLLSVHAFMFSVGLLEGVGGEKLFLNELNLIINWLFVSKASSMSDQESKQYFSAT